MTHPYKNVELIIIHRSNIYFLRTYCFTLVLKQGFDWQSLKVGYP